MPDEPNKKQEEKVTEEKTTVPSPKLSPLIDEIKGLTALELADLVKALEDTFGVTAMAPIPVASVAATGAPSEDAGEEQTTFNVILKSPGANKISVIKAVRELVPTLGLKEAKDLVEAAPKNILTGVAKDQAETAEKKLKDAGAEVERK